ncbi:cell shape determination protein CcmA [Dethiosulfatarculus sandiegensis]|uniref:Cell shape determination protein CcmA n=1 Tax=Dethiosulfatarculus sandiegensis TaxID=1429043 RepID=A0A0D2JVL1_9BACT|nr:cell shape determination protein CcmA [Dethiosulfatarculus sandiegensis]
MGQHISIQGDIKGSEDLLIEGKVKGSVELPQHHLTVGAKGQVEAAIHADRVTISGTLVGNIAANGKVEITKEADFTGEIKAGRISVEDGAYLKAVVELKRDSGSRPVSAPKPVDTEPKLGLATGESAKAKK